MSELAHGWSSTPPRRRDRHDGGLRLWLGKSPLLARRASTRLDGRTIADEDRGARFGLRRGSRGSPVGVGSPVGLGRPVCLGRPVGPGSPVGLDASTAQIERREWRPHRDCLPRLSVQLRDNTGEWRRQLHNRLGSLDLGEWLIERYRISDGDVPGDELRLGEPLSEVGQSEVPDHADHPESEFARPSTRSTASRIRSRSGRK